VAAASFVLLVLVVPLAAGLVWEHQRNTSIRQFVAFTRDVAVEQEWRTYDEGRRSCATAEVLRIKQNSVIRELRRREVRFHDPRFRLADADGKPILPNAPVDCAAVIPRPTTPRPTEPG
jgi:hypothetical protein